ncbi:hypothetical protein ACSHWO_36165 (plasmid) [Streptomyces sp. HUAS TT3]|uniref:hypothetical protein n=1 Tax=Streptomyces sp. HUAS TT3 TaxID=3447510 RepID=UPI003F65F18A
MGVGGNTFNGPAAFVSGDHATQHVTFVHQWKPAYRIEGFPAAPRPVRARALAEQPSRLLRATHEVVPFTGRGTDLTELARWRDDPAEHLAVRLVHGPGGQGKTRLASHFADLSRRAGWTVWQAIVNETGADPVDARPLRNLGSGVLLVVDYAERWPTSDLHGLLRDPLLHRAGVPVRILLLARPGGCLACHVSASRGPAVEGCGRGVGVARGCAAGGDGPQSGPSPVCSGRWPRIRRSPGSSTPSPLVGTVC